MSSVGFFSQRAPLLQQKHWATWWSSQTCLVQRRSRNSCIFRHCPNKWSNSASRIPFL